MIATANSSMICSLKCKRLDVSSLQFRNHVGKFKFIWLDHLSGNRRLGDRWVLVFVECILNCKRRERKGSQSERRKLELFGRSNECNCQLCNSIDFNLRLVPKDAPKTFSWNGWHWAVSVSTLYFDWKSGSAKWIYGWYPN